MQNEIKMNSIWLHLTVMTFSFSFFLIPCLVELEELLFQFLSVGLVAVSPEPLHGASAPVWSLEGSPTLAEMRKNGLEDK